MDVSSKESISPAELGRLYDEHASAVHRLAFSLLTQRQEAEDLTHDVFVRLQRGGYDSDRGSIRHYLLLMTRSMALNRLNKNRNRNRILRWFQPRERHHEPVDLQAIEMQINLEEAMAQLSLREQRILAMNFQEDISQSNIAMSLNLPLGTVKTISRRALLKLRHALSTMEDI